MKIKNHYYQIAVALVMAFMVSCAPEPTEETTADYSGTWTCTETTSNPAGTSSYTVRLKRAGTVITEYKIENFYNTGYKNEAAVTIGASSITINSQTIGSGSTSFTASGSGSVISSSKLEMNYKMDDGSGAIDNCNATFVKL
jgi:hypothetical protein